VAYVSFEHGQPSIFRQVLATGERERLTQFRGMNSSPAYSPDGTKLAMVLSKDGTPDIYVMDLATKALTKYAANNFAIDTEPAWMPDGQSIVFTSNRGGKPQIYQVLLGDGTVSRITFQGRYNAKAQPLADGSGFILVHQDGGGFNIARFDPEKNRTYVLTSTNLDESPSIAANGSMVMYAAKRGNKGVLAVVSVDGNVKTILPSSDDGDVREPAWSPFL
jgi:TolB protein